MFRVIFVIGIFLTSLYLNFPALADRTHIPSYVFEDHPSGQKALHSARATNASLAHRNGLKGRTKTGKRLLAAVIDCQINANLPHMQDLKRQGFIHPAALSFNNPYMMNPEEELDQYALLDDKLTQEHYDLIIKEIYSNSSKEKNKLKQQIHQINIYLKKIEYLRPRTAVWDFQNQPDADAHGAGVIQALHQIAPEASILPIDLAVMTQDRNNRSLTSSQALTQSIRAAIDHGADIINLSRYLVDLDQAGFQAMAEAVRKGIVIITSAGNDSSDFFPCYIRQFYDEIKNIFVTSKEQELFDKLKGKGIIFAGSTGIDPFGKEKVSNYSQHPEEDTRKNFVLAPGENLNIQASNNPQKLVRGTSFSAPVIAGAFLDLKQHCIDKGYYATSDDLINVLYESGHDIVYKRMWPFNDEIFKSADVLKACQHADERFKSKKAPFGMAHPITPVVPTLLKPAPVVEKPPFFPVPTLEPALVVKPSVKAKTVSKPVRKKKAVKAKKTRKKPVVKQKTVKIKRTRRKPATKTKPALIKSRSKKPVSKKVKAPKKSIVKQTTVSPKKTPRKPVTNKKPISKKRVKSKK